MNLSDCKTIKEYREAAHYWQKKWAQSEEKNKELNSKIKSIRTIVGEIPKMPWETIPRSRQ